MNNVKAYLEQCSNIGNQQAQDLLETNCPQRQQLLSFFVEVGLLTKAEAQKESYTHWEEEALFLFVLLDHLLVEGFDSQLLK